MDETIPANTLMPPDATEGSDLAPSVRAKALREEIFGSSLTLDEVAYILGLDRTTVAKYLRDKVVLGFQVGREWRVTEDALRTYVHGLINQQAQQGSEQSSPVQPRQQFQSEGLLSKGKRLIQGRGHSQPGEQPIGKQIRFDKFTERARKVLTLAQEEAMCFNHNYIGTEHLLLGLVREGDGLAAKVLANLGVDLHLVRSKVESIIGRGDRQVLGEVGLTPRAKKVIELTVDEARRLGHHYIGTEHVLLGLVREGEGIAATVLEALGVQLESVREEIVRLLGNASPNETQEEQIPPPPEEAASLLVADQPSHTCSFCAAQCPTYFRHCYNCGAVLSEAE